MRTSENTLKNFVSLCGMLKVYEVEEYTKKELSDKDCYFLRYCLRRFIYYNQSRIWQFSDMVPERLYYEVDESASICDNALYIGDFVGYDIAEDTKIMSIELTIENRVILNVFNTEKDSYKEYLIY